jgi:hypothetical protein
VSDFIDPMTRIRLEKAALDCGFELTPELKDGALVLRSAQFPGSVEVRRLNDTTFDVSSASSQLTVSRPPGSGLQGYQGLYVALERAAATARNLPNRVAQKFHSATATLPKTTEAERWVVQRVGQDLFRGALLDYWRGRCCVTGLVVPELLRASHIKPWALCDTDEERLDVFNGLLLAPHLDALFDGGWVTFSPIGTMLVAQAMQQDAMAILGIHAGLGIQGLSSAHQPYLEFHRHRVWRDAA